ncbi:uncharacterized protein LOC119741048 isoform X2 [Patiria miniata]|uniref:Uncharacterized protein n=1 Tax=Patiria miniata TaxID=46514 RepID=A0A914B9R8_PATMI|nr:uncharacterized protein LOC119741048 isoform X2 [Patiria miniata]
MRVILRGDVVQPGLCCSPGQPVERWKHCDDVGLVDGGVPTIGGSEASIILEPAVWSKVLVVDTVYFDAIRNSIQWTMCCRRNCTQRIMGEETTYQRCRHTQECLLNEDFYPLVVDMQRGIDLAKRILVRQDDEDSVDLLHLLHVYILPIIKLCSEDKEHVTQALTNQEQTLQKLNVKIDEMTEQRRMLKQTMRQWREDMCEHLQSETAIVSCNSSFLKLLCEQLKADVEYGYIYIELETWKKKVQEAKLRVQKKGGRRYVGQLNAAKVGRDAVEERMTKLMYVHNAGLALCASRVSDEQKVSDPHEEAYMKIQDEWKGHEKERIELVRRKICALSVREALFHTEEELTRGSQTTGVEISSDGTQRPTDVLGESSLPEGWETLQSQVAKSLELNPVIHQLHGEFTHWIRSYCTKELAGPRSNSFSWKGKLPLQCTQVEDSANVTCLRISPDILSVRQSIKERKPATHFQGLTKTLQNEVCLHFREVVHELVKDHSVPSTCSARLWTCYERRFFSSHSDDILRLYERAYAEDTKKLESTLPTYTVRDILLGDEWILNILGLYAPDFLSPTLENPVDTAEEGQLAEELNKEFEKEDEAGVKITEAKDVKDDETKSRERLESGISVHGDEKVQVIRREKDPSKTDSLRKSHRNTEIIDLTWVTRQASLSERSSTWSSLERKSHMTAASVFGESLSLPIDIPNTNSNARTLSIPIISSVGDSGVSLNIPTDDDATRDLFEALQAGHSSADSKDPLDKCCRDNPNSKVFLERFQTAYNCFRVALQYPVPMSKLQWLFSCIQEVNTTAEKQSRLIFCGKSRMMSGDDLLDALVLFLLHGDVKEVANGYHHIMMLLDYMPDFLQMGQFGFTLSQFLLAYTHILDHYQETPVTICDQADTG